MGFFSKKKLLVTHNGGFHADDVFAAATLLLIYPDAKIIRTRDPEMIKKGDIVFDVGGVYDENTNRFDHHQAGGAGKRENGIPFSSFGLIWKKFGTKLCSEEEVRNIDRRIVSFIDALDNGVDLFENKTEVSNFSVSSVVGDFNKTSLENGDNNDSFLEVVDIAKKIIFREIASAQDFLYVEKKVIEAYEKAADKRLVYLDGDYDKFIVADVLGRYPETLYSIKPKADGSYAMNSVKVSGTSFQSRKSLPSAWAGKRDKEFQEITGVSDAIFCHNGLWVAYARSLEGINKLAILALSN